jgi:hypothetical protein
MANSPQSQVLSSSVGEKYQAPTDKDNPGVRCTLYHQPMVMISPFHHNNFSQMAQSLLIVQYEVIAGHDGHIRSSEPLSRTVSYIRFIIARFIIIIGTSAQDSRDSSH